MTEHIKIKSINPRIQYLGNGSVTEFQFQFAIFSEDDITIYINQDKIISGFTVSGVGDSDGGYITFDVAPSDGDLITIIRELEIERVTDFQEGGTFRAKNINDELDRFTAYSQQVSEKIGRSLIIPPYVDGEVDLSLPLPAAGKSLKWNANETGLENTSANIDEIASDAAASATSAATSAAASANSASNSANTATLAQEWAAKMDGLVDSTDYSSKYYASQSANTATLAQEWAAKMDGQVASTDYSSKYYAQTAAAQIPLVTAAGQAQVALASNEADRAATEASKAIGLEIGSLISSSLPILNAVKYVLADGTQYSTTGVYQAFADYLAQVKLTHPQCFVTQAEFDADVASTGQCGRYVLDTINFRVPKITRYIGATVNLADIGKAWSESLPNITGATSLVTDNNDMFDYGAFYKDSVNRKAGIYGAAAGTSSVNAFDASRSSSTYQDGAKVNPERVTYPYYIVVSNAGQMTPVEIDINNVMTDLALKADKDAVWTPETSTQAQKETIVGWGMPDYSAEVSVAENGLPSIAPYAMMIYYRCSAPGQNNSFYIEINGKKISQGNYGGEVSLVVYAPKGATLSRGRTGGGFLELKYYPLLGVN